MNDRATIGERYLEKSAEIHRRQQQTEWDQTPKLRKRGTPKKKSSDKTLAVKAKPQNLISPMEAAKRLGLLDDDLVKCPKLTVIRMARRGELVSVKVGRCVRIRPESVDDWIESNT